MAARLTVIISQSARREGRLVDIEETLVTELMMSPGMDATLVGPLENIRPDSTDYLCLNGFQHSLALVSWLEEEDVREHWDRLALGGTVRRFGSPGEQPAGSGRIVYFFQLSGGVDSSIVLAELVQLQSDRSVKTVSLDMLTPVVPNPDRANTAATGAGLAAGAGLAVMQPRPSEPQLTESKATEQQDRGAAQDNSPVDATAIAKIGPLPPPQDDLSLHSDDEEWESLDRLVEDFDALDL